MIIKDHELYLWRKEHLAEVESQVKMFLDRQLVRSNSQKSYDAKLTALSNLCGWQKKLPNEILAEFKQRKKKDPYKFLNEYIAFLISIKTSPNSIKDYVGGAKKWLNASGIQVLNETYREKVDQPKPRKLTQDKTPTPEQMAKVLENTNLRGRTLLTMLLSSGMRIDELLKTKIQDIDFNIHPTAVHIWGENEKNDEERWTFISDEAAEFLKLYLRGRTKGYIFLGRHQGVKPDGTTYIRGDIDPNEHMDYSTADCIFTTALKNADLRELDKNGRDVYHIHKLKSFFKTYIGPHVDSHYVRAFCSHGSDADQIYDAKPVAEIAKVYEKGMHAVTILKRTDTKAVKELEAKLDDEKRATDRVLDHDRSKVNALEVELKDVRARLDAANSLFLGKLGVSLDDVAAVVMEARERTERKVALEIEEQKAEELKNR